MFIFVPPKFLIAFLVFTALRNSMRYLPISKLKIKDNCDKTKPKERILTQDDFLWRFVLFSVEAAAARPAIA
jgi:hypothetical protein